MPFAIDCKKYFGDFPFCPFAMSYINEALVLYHVTPCGCLETPVIFQSILGKFGQKNENENMIVKNVIGSILQLQCEFYDRLFPTYEN